MSSDSAARASLRTSLAPWLSVREAAKAIDFYKAAFGASEVYHHNSSPESLKGGTVRMILTVADPDAIFAQARKAGAAEVYPVSEEHGWRVGRVADPFGHHWEIGRQLTA